MTTYEIRYNLTGAPVTDIDTLLVAGIADGVEAYTHMKDAVATGAAVIGYGIKAVDVGGSSVWVQASVSGVVSTTTTLTSNVTTVVTGDVVTLTADTTADIGTIQFKKDGVDLGTPVAVDATGVAVTTDAPATAGTVVYGAAYIATGTWGGSTANDVTVTVSVPAPPPDPTAFRVVWTDPTTNTLSWVDSTDPSATYEIRYNLTGAPMTDVDPVLVTGIAGGTQTYLHTKDASAQSAMWIGYGIKAINAIGPSGLVQENSIKPFTMYDIYGGGPTDKTVSPRLPGALVEWDGTDIVMSWTGANTKSMAMLAAYYPNVYDQHPWGTSGVSFANAEGLWREWNVGITVNGTVLASTMVVVTANWTPWNYGSSGYMGNFYFFIDETGAWPASSRGWAYQSWAGMGMVWPPPDLPVSDPMRGYWSVGLMVFGEIGTVPPMELRFHTDQCRFAWGVPGVSPFSQETAGPQETIEPLSPKYAAALETAQAMMLESAKESRSTK